MGKVGITGGLHNCNAFNVNYLCLKKNLLDILYDYLQNLQLFLQFFDM